MRSVVCFLSASNVRPGDIHRQLCEVYGENAMSDSMIRKWVRNFNDATRSAAARLWFNDDLVQSVE